MMDRSPCKLQYIIRIQWISIGVTLPLSMLHDRIQRDCEGTQYVLHRSSTDTVPRCGYPRKLAILLKIMAI
jgi:hypothetical protein